MKIRLLFSTGLLLLLFACGSKQVDYRRPVELRGVCIDGYRSGIYETPRTVAEAMHFLGINHFNTVFPLIRVDVRMIEQCRLTPGLTGGTPDSIVTSRDVFKELVHEAHRQELRIIPLVEYGSPDSLVHWTDADSLTVRQWFITDSTGKLLESNGVRWLNLFHPEVRQAIVDFFGYLISEYKVDGVMGGGHLFSQPLQGVYSDSIRTYFFQQEYGDLLAEQYGESDWQRWYREETNRNIRKIYKELKKKYPAVLIYWLADASGKSTTEIVQDWPNWLNGGYADLVIPLIHAADIKSYERVLSSLHPDSIALFRNKERIVPGVVLNIGISMNMTSFVLRVVETNRHNGYKGEIFFGFNILYGKDSRVTTTLRKTHYLRPAAVWQAPLY